MGFFVADEEDIKKGLTTDIYFKRTEEILRKLGVSKKVVAEFTVSGFPSGYSWGIFCGLEEVIEILEGKKVDLYALREGTLFRARDITGVLVPVMVIEGDYKEFAIYETPILGFICQSSGIATKAARIKYIAKESTVLSFGIRRMHPAISPMIDRAAYIGGCDGVSSIIGAMTVGEKPKGTMPHSLIIVLGEENAWKRFDELMDKDIPRVALIDTYSDEKTASIRAAEIVKNLNAVRLDTPGSRRGNFSHIVREVRWELDLRGFKDVEIFVSGGLDEETVRELKKAGASGFGVGTSISNAPTIDFAMDIVEVEGKPAAKKGKFGGRKKVLRCPNCFQFSVNQESSFCPICKIEMEEVLEMIIEKGKRITEKESPKEIRNYVLSQLRKVKEI